MRNSSFLRTYRSWGIGFWTMMTVKMINWVKRWRAWKGSQIRKPLSRIRTTSNNSNRSKKTSTHKSKYRRSSNRNNSSMISYLLPQESLNTTKTSSNTINNSNTWTQKLKISKNKIKIKIKFTRNPNCSMPWSLMKKNMRRCTISSRI